MSDRSKPRTAQHPACGAVWPNVERNSHCPVCHQTFGNHRIADKHRRTVDGERVCINPSELTVDGFLPVQLDGIWKKSRVRLSAL